VKPALTLADLQWTARAHGGECLSTVYLGAQSKQIWRCSLGHEWEARANSVRNGSWCPACATDRVANAYFLNLLLELKFVAQSKGGECLTSTLMDHQTKPIFRCELGHEFKSDVQRILKGLWCPTCRGRGRPRLSIADLQETARTHGGECLSDVCHGALAKHRWRCAEGHEWEALASQIRTGCWCPICNNLPRLTLADLQENARANGGECLSEVCLGSNAKHHWRCAEGHEWEAQASQIRQGYWCPICGAQRSKAAFSARRRGQPRTPDQSESV